MTRAGQLRPLPMPNGWIILDKPRGLGSTQAVAAVKRNLREAGYGKVKVGHGGTLDPLAEGVLPIALGEATKLAGRMLDASKIYDFTIEFGAETDTLDPEGEVVAHQRAPPAAGAVAAILAHFTGAIEQVPPAYSALKVDGKRAYDLARAGEEVELATRGVTIHSLDSAEPASREPLDSAFATSAGRPDPFDPRAPLELADTRHAGRPCLARAPISAAWRAISRMRWERSGTSRILRRTKAGPFAETQAISLDKLNEIGKGARA